MMFMPADGKKGRKLLINARLFVHVVGMMRPQSNARARNFGRCRGMAVVYLIFRRLRN